VTPDAERLLCRLRIAVLEVRIFENELEHVGVALRHGLLNAAGAGRWLDDIGAAGWLPPDIEPEIDILPDRKRRA
jgi:hypothetical protein